MKQVVYRLEDANNRGPYRTSWRGGSESYMDRACEITIGKSCTDVFSNHPTPQIDFSSNYPLPHHKRKLEKVTHMIRIRGGVCGFSSLKQMVNWFSMPGGGRILTALEDMGIMVTRIVIDTNDVIYTCRQVVFVDDKAERVDRFGNLRDIHLRLS